MNGVYDAVDATDAADANATDAADANATDASDPDAIDAADANALECLNQHLIVSAVFTPEEVEPNESPELVQPPEDPLDQTEVAVNSEPAQLVIERFALGRPGAPMDGTHRSPSMYEDLQSTFGDSLWAPFRSERDWEVAYWAKMQGPSLSALTKLFAIPGVRATCCFLIILLTHHQSL